MADGKIVNHWVSDDKDMMRSIERMNKQITKLQDQLRNAGKISKKSTDKAEVGFKNAAKMAKGFAGALGLAGGVAGAIVAVNRGFDTWLTNVKAVSTASRKAANDIIAFAAIQAGGESQQAVFEAAKLGQKYGLTDRGAVFNTVQAMQSGSGGDRAKGMRKAERIFQAMSVSGSDLSLESATEVEAVGGALNLGAGTGLRRAYIMGQLSEKTPGAAAEVFPKLVDYGEKENLRGAAVGTQMLSLFDAAKAGTFAKAVAIGTSNKYEKAYKTIGIGRDATRMERLQALKDKGIDTVDELRDLGITEQRQQVGLATIVTNLDKVKRYRKEIEERDVPGLFAGKRKQLVGDLPFLEQEERIRQVETQFQDISGGIVPGRQGARASALRFEIKRKERATAIRSLGLETGLFGKARITPEGDLTPWGVKEMMASESLLGPVRPAGPGVHPSAAMFPGGAPGPTVEETIRNEIVRLRKSLERQRPAVRQEQ